MTKEKQFLKGEGENKQFKMGGVAEKIVRDASLPVVIVSQPEDK